ncbi:alanine racemase [Telmatospirillum sp.]|uniref:alanine racemase n=1 Tax=Telmatospirillum sp. TaxID=2079197 RepID=UPI002847ACB4|nr:alanine racemase [Telmatospirillum sp.]MDR3438757.1 alanine racemase [Telmatospirillum sp.]
MISRRILLAGGAAAAIAVALARPREFSGGHSAYFANLNTMLHNEGIDRPVLLIDLDRLDRNIDRLVASARTGTPRNYRIAVKSVPTPGLVDYIASRAATNSGMVFDRPFLEDMARLRPRSDLLLGKPMPVAAAATFYDHVPGAFDPSRQLQWLIDSDARLAQYLELAQDRRLRMRINLEIDVGLHRGGYADPAALAGALQTIADHPELLIFSGFMGYDGHLLGLPGFLADGEASKVKQRYGAFVDVLRRRFPQFAGTPLTFNGAGSPSFRYHESGSPLNDISVGSALLKPAHYDLPLIADFEPSAFIATPVLKRGASNGIPTMEWLGGPMVTWDRNTTDMLFTYGGNWLAEPLSPTGVRPAGLYTSSNQEGYYAAKGVALAVDDFLFLRPTQSEAVLLQFGDLLGVRGSTVEQRWPVLTVGL